MHRLVYTGVRKEEEAMQCEIARQFFDMLTALSAQQRIPREYSAGQTLYQAELLLLEKIDAYPEANASALSARCGVTKSAVTQMSGRLVEKGLAAAYRCGANKKEKYLRLTSEGRRALAEYTRQNEAAAAELRRYLCSLSAGEKRTILAFIAKMKDCMPVCAFPCSGGETACPAADNKKRMEPTCWS